MHNNAVRFYYIIFSQFKLMIKIIQFWVPPTLPNFHQLGSPPLKANNEKKSENITVTSY